MKKITAWLITLAMLLPMVCVSVTAEEWSPTETAYTADLTNAEEASKWNCVTGTNAPVIADGEMKWASAGKTSYLLPVQAMENVVIEADITHTSGNNYFAFLFGSDGTADNISKNEVRLVAKQTRAYLLTTCGSNRDSGKTAGYQWDIAPYTQDDVISDLYQSSKLKLVIYNKRLAVWRNDQLIYSYTLTDTYTGGYVGFETNYYGGCARSLSVREATANDLVLAESFNEADLTNCSFTELTTTNKLTAGKWGTASFSKNGGLMTWIDGNKATVDDHVYSACFTFGSTNNGATRYLSPMFGLTDNEDGTMSGYCVYTKINGDIAINKITVTSEGAVTAGEKLGSAAGASVRAMFADKLGAIGETEVLALDTPWEYRHILKDGTLYVYLDDVLVATADIADTVSGYTGFFVSGMNSTLHYFGVTDANDADVTRPNEFTARLCDASGEYQTLSGKTLRFYTLSETTDEAGETVINENLYGTAYTDANGLFEIELGDDQPYLVKLYDGMSGEAVASTNIVYEKTKEQTVVDFESEADFSVIADIDFADGAAVDSSTKANTLTLYNDAKTAAMPEFGGKEALVLGGVGDNARFDSSTAFELDKKDKLTVETVFIPRERDGIKEMAVIGGTTNISSSKKGGYGIYVDQNSDGEDVISFRVSTGEYVMNTLDVPCEMNKVYYVAGVYDGSTMKLYLNGELLGTKVASGDIATVTTVTPALGCEWYYLNNLKKYYFKGELSDAIITNGAKSAETITEAYNAYVADGYMLGTESTDDITVKVSFDNTAPVKGDTVKVTAAVRNASDSDKSVSVMLKPGYFAAPLDADTKTADIPAGETANIEFTYKLLEGGREPFKAYVYEDGTEVAYDCESLSVIGSGYYKSETHNHSTRSDGVNAFEENVLEGFTTKNISYAFSTEHNQYNYWDYQKAVDTSALYNPQQFVVHMASEYTTPRSHANVYSLDLDFSTKEAAEENALFWSGASRPTAFTLISEDGENVSAEKYNEFIDRVVNEQGGYIYINHPNDPTYYCKDEQLQDMRGFTGIEIWNGFQTCFDYITLNQRNSWDKINSQGWGHVIGQAGTDAHSSVAYATVQKVAYLDELTRAEIDRVVADGNAIGTNGPEIRFDINGAPLNGTAVTADAKAMFNIDVYDPMGDILEVKLVKNKVSGEFTVDNREEIVLFEKADDAIGEWKYNELRDIADGEFYRVEVTTAKSPYGSISSYGTSFETPGADMGWAFTNNIWIETEGTNNSTNISEISLDSENVELMELATGIRYLCGSGEITLEDITVKSDGEAVITNDGDLITVTVTAEDGTVKKTEIYTVGDITITEKADEPKTEIECDIIAKTSSEASATVTINDEEALIGENGAVVIMAVYSGEVLVGVDIENVVSTDTEKTLTAVYNEVQDTDTLTVKAMLVKDMNNLTPLAKAVIGK